MGRRPRGGLLARNAAALTLAAFVATVGAGCGGGGGSGSDGDAIAAVPAGCPVATTTSAYRSRVLEALRARRDLWGERLLRRAGGPTYAGAASLLRPLLLAGAPGRTLLTESGVYYLPFGVPAGAQGTSLVALHVADGSQIVSRRVGGDSLTVFVGAGGGERYGSCVAWLTRARLGEGWLPILQTRYTDAAGAHYAQESFAARVAGAGSLVSFVRVGVDTRQANSAVSVRLTPSSGASGHLVPGPDAGRTVRLPSIASRPARRERSTPPGWRTQPTLRWSTGQPTTTPGRPSPPPGGAGSSGG